MKELNKIPSKHLVVQHNDLIASKYDLNLSEMRLILEAVHNVEKDDADFKEYRIDVNSFLELVDSKNVSEYSRVKEFCKTILSKPLEIPKEDGNFLFCNWFSNIEYNPKNRTIDYSFDPKLKPYLIELKEKFTRFDIRILLKFKSFYGLRIYMILKSESWKGNNIEYIIKVDELRTILKLENKYSLYGHFKKRVLDIARRYINEVSDIEVDFEDIKVGRKVESIKFKVKRKPLKIENEKDESINALTSFKTFKEYIIQNFTDDSICNSVPNYKKDVVIGLNPLGYLKNEKFGDDLKPDAAKEFWQWLFKNQNRVGDIIEFSNIEKRIDNLIGKKLFTTQKDVFGAESEIELIVKEITEAEEGKYKLTLVDQHGSNAKTPQSYSLNDLDNMLV